MPRRGRAKRALDEKVSQDAVGGRVWISWAAVARLEGRRVLVVGASGGLGRAIAVRLDADGAHIAVAARRVELLEQLRAQAGGRPKVLVCDVRDPDACVATVGSAVEQLGGLDGLVYAPGMAVITQLWKAGAAHWRSALATNLVGAALVTAAAIPHLEESEGVAVYLSSVSAHLTPPWKGMGLYLASKVALEKCVEVWKLEHPRVRFTTMVIGSTSGNEFFSHAETPFPEDIDGFQRDWHARGYLASEQLDPEDQAEAVVHVLASRAQIDVMWSRNRSQLQVEDS
jgi:NAD(P)-dependent dehydrogenase (short-subunit alcohol dehydrogenase family)